MCFKIITVFIYYSISQYAICFTELEVTFCDVKFSIRNSQITNLSRSTLLRWSDFNLLVFHDNDSFKFEVIFLNSGVP